MDTNATLWKALLSSYSEPNEGEKKGNEERNVHKCVINEDHKKGDTDLQNGLSN